MYICICSQLKSKPHICHPPHRLKISVQMVAASLLGFYREGWEPMTPIDTASKADKRGGQVWTIINQSFLLLNITIVRC